MIGTNIALLKMTPIQLIDYFGGTTATARALGISPPSVTEWKTRHIPVERCIQIEQLTGGEVRCEQLRPDINWSVLRKQPV